MKILCMVLAALALAGCQTRAEREAGFRQQCESYGAKFGSPEFVQCMATLVSAYRQSAATIAAGLEATP